MMLRVFALPILVCGPEETRRAAELRAYAEAHPLDPGDWQRVTPGDCPEHVMFFGGYRVVFSVELLPKGPTRYLSVTPVLHEEVPRVQELVRLFGYEGTWTSWYKYVEFSRFGDALVIVQPVLEHVIAEAVFGWAVD